MDEFKEYPNSGIEIAVLGSDQLLPIDYVVSLRTSEGKICKLTAADYYYEALELMLINRDSGNMESIPELIQFIDQFRDLIYKTLISPKKTTVRLK